MPTKLANAKQLIFFSICFLLFSSPAWAEPHAAFIFVENALISLVFAILGLAAGIFFFREKRHEIEDSPHSSRYLAAIERISQGFTLFLRPDQEATPKQAVEWLLRETAKTIDASQVSFWVFENNQTALKVKYFFDARSNKLQINMRMSKDRHPGIFGTLRGERTISFSDARNDMRCLDLMESMPEGTQPKSILIATVGVGKQAHGTLQVNTRRRLRKWNDSDKQFASSIADLIAFYLSTHDLQITKKALQGTEKRFRDLVDASSDWYWETDEEHRFSYFSEQFTSQTGLPQQKLLGKTRNIFAEDAAMSAKWVNHWDDLQNHRPFRDFQYSTEVNGRDLCVTINGKPYFDENGAFRGYRGTGTDITETKTYKTRFEEGINALPNGFLMWDADDRLVMWNKTILEMFPVIAPYANRSFTYLELIKICERENAVKYPKPLTDAFCSVIVAQHKSCTSSEIELSNGKHLLVHEHATSEGGIVGIYTDITNIKAREKELIQNKLYSEVLTKCSNVLFHARNESFILSEICRIITETPPFDIAWISLFNSPGQLPEFLKINMQRGLDISLVDHRPSSTLKQAFIKQEFMEMNETLLQQAFPDFKDSFIQSEIKCAGIFPIWIDTKIAGFLNVATKERSKFKQRHINLLREISNDVGYGLSSLRSEHSRLIAEEALRESEGRYRSLVDMSPDAILVLDENNKIVFSNPEGHALFVTKNRVEILNRPFLDFIVEDKPIFAHAPDFKSEDPTEYLNSIKLRKTDQTIFEADITSRPVSYAGLTTRLLIIRDVTERNRVNEHLAQTSKLATLGEMAAGITHELSQPLNIMRFAAEGSLLKMSKNKITEEEIQKQFDLISMQSGRMADIIDHMRVFSRKDTGSVETFDPTLVISQSVDMVEAQFLAEGIQLEVRYPAHYGMLKGRPIQLEQVILNLINNARDAINQRHQNLGDDEIAEKIISVLMIYDQADHEINIAVTDNGGGIPEEALAKLFDPFFTTKEVGKGTGLGLSVSYGIIAAMGGIIRARNIHKGARFDINLPCFTPQEKDEQQVENASPLEIAQTYDEDNTPDEDLEFDVDGASVLVVDDEIYAAEAMMEYLYSHGLQVNIASNGEEALELYDLDPVDVVVTDMRMPKMDGYVLIKNLKERNPDIPIIVVTGHTGMEDISQEDLNRLAFSILKKPVSLSELSSQVEKAAQSIGKDKISTFGD
ncbi:putative Histidine kinase [Candidatus Terasakiella magnetica]|uniref:histidine kinase n=1 Tax=Candidatus Terasakiella magnetica TaxID=1867952 RepID=A0A1C3RL33_9PROT|nr:PAS domain S-box protein [Candidatus Terasakiella magnetica]SCA58030.1 putative Histidine kinase [Candidatus Terasakiella magnetica]